MDEEELVKKHVEWYSKNSSYHFEQGFRHGLKHGREENERKKTK